MNIDLKGKTALGTGSTSGVGHAIAKGLAGAGANVVVNGRPQGKVDAAVAAIAKAAPGGKIAGVAADVSTAAECQTLVETLPDVDILINNAGIFEPKGFFDIADEDWRDRKSTRLNSSHQIISYAVFCLKKKKDKDIQQLACERRARTVTQHTHLTRH